MFTSAVMKCPVMYTSATVSAPWIIMKEEHGVVEEWVENGAELN